MLRLACLLATTTLLPASARAQPPIRDGEYVRAEGTRFVADGRAFHVVGANAGVMHGRDQRSRATAVLEAAAADGLSLVRIWALGEYPEDAPAWARDYAFRVGPDGWVEESFAHLDHVLAEARRLELRVVVVLANRWGDYGGVPAYLRWTGVELDRHPPPLALTAFWECERCEARYQEHVRRVVGRVSTATGRPYAEDPTIFAWELMNEAEAAGAVGEPAMLRWVERQAELVRALDPNHMISAGHIGYTRQRERALWTRVCALPVVSYCDSHAYPLRPGRLRSETALARWIDDRAQLAHHVVEKPLLFGEIGVPSDRRAVHGRHRARWLGAFLHRVLENGVGGAAIWTYLPSETRPRTYAVYVDGERSPDTADLRRALARAASAARERAPRSINPRIGPRFGDAPRFDATAPLVGPGEVHRAWVADGDASFVRIDPRRFERARFEGAGTWEGSPGVPHFYGAGRGAVTYRLRRPAASLTELTVRLRASSELPGAGAGASPEDTSALSVWLDDVELGPLVAPPDDGLGEWIELRVAPARLGALRRRAVHRLTIRADDGVCLYGTTERGEPAGIELRWR